jgi:hypothetical protein
LTSSVVSTIGTPSEDDIPRLVRFTFERNGASMSCHYCQRRAAIANGDVAGQILQFQEVHFGCDPALAATR